MERVFFPPMRLRPVLLLPILTLCFTSSGFAFLDIFKKDLDKVPETAELRAEEAAAKVMVTEALEYETAGKTDKAFSAYRSVVKKFPETTSAAISQYKVGAIQKSRGDYVKAFDSYQTFIDNYKQSSAFSSAIASQFEIAQASQSGDHKEKFMGITRMVQRSEVLKMYGKVIENAPYSEYAPQSQFAIGEVLEDEDKGAEAALAYKKVVASYPKSKLAADAQFRIAEIGRMAVEDGSRNMANVDSSRRAYEDLVIGFDNDERAEEAKTRMVQFDELEAQKAFDVGRFYEKQKKYKSAELYYRRVAQSTGTTAAAEAQERLAIVQEKISEAPPEASARPVASGAAKIKEAIPRPKLGSRIFGRKKRAEAEAEEARLAAIEGDRPAPAVTASSPPAPGRTAIPSSSAASRPSVASAAPRVPKTSKRKDYVGPSKPSLGLAKKENRMRMDMSQLKNLPLGNLPLDNVAGLDKKDLQKGLKKITENLPEDIPAKLEKMPKDLSDLVIPPDIDEEDAIGKLDPSPEDGDDGEDSLIIPAPPEDDE